MFATIATIRANVRVKINEATEKFWLSDDIDADIVEALEDIAHETHCLRTWKTYTILADDIFDSRELRMDSDFIAIDEGKVYYNDVVCYPTTQAALSHFDSEWRERTGTPSKYYMRGDMLGFNCQISAGDTVKFYQIERAAEISGSVVPFNGDYRLINFRKLARDYAVSMCWDKKNEDIKAQIWMNRYEKGVDHMKDLLCVDMDSKSAMIPEDSLSHFTTRAKWPEW